MIIFHSGSGGDFFSAFGRWLPMLLILVAFLNIAGVFGKKRGDDEYELPEDEEEPEGGQPQQEPPAPQDGGSSRKRDDIDALIAKMEEKLRQGRKEEPYQGTQGGGRLYRENASEGHRTQPVYTDGAAAGSRLHREECAVPHQKARVYRETQSWGAEGAGVLSAASRERAQAPAPARTRLRFKRAELVQGFIMSQVLDRPRSLKPYGEDPGQ